MMLDKQIPHPSPNLPWCRWEAQTLLEDRRNRDSSQEPGAYFSLCPGNSALKSGERSPPLKESFWFSFSCVPSPRGSEQLEQYSSCLVRLGLLSTLELSGQVLLRLLLAQASLPLSYCQGWTILGVPYSSDR